nr:hypothetical protein [Candidatus Entotheonella palauensis]
MRCRLGTTLCMLMGLRIPVLAAAMALPRHSPVPGGVAVVPLNMEASYAEEAGPPARAIQWPHYYGGA